jgi:hypothetical protein
MEERIQTRATGLAFSAQCYIRTCPIVSLLIALFVSKRDGMSSQDTEYEKCGFVEFFRTDCQRFCGDGRLLTFYAFMSSLAA